MKNRTSKTQRRKAQKGQALVEYAVLLALISIVAVNNVARAGASIRDRAFKPVNDAFDFAFGTGNNSNGSSGTGGYGGYGYGSGNNAPPPGATL